MNDIQVRAQKIGVYAKYGGLGLIVCLAIPVLFALGLIIAAAASIAAATVVGAGVALVGGIALVQLLPWFQMKMENTALKLMKAEARKNPVETAQNQIRKEAAQLDAYIEETKARLAQGNSLVKDTLELAKTDPAGAAESQQDILNFHREMEIRKGNIIDRTKALEARKAKVARAAKRWEHKKKHTTFKNMTEERAALNEIILEEALDEINQAGHRGSADIEVDNFVQGLKKGNAPDAVQVEPCVTSQQFLADLRTFDMGDILDVAPKEKVIAQ